MTAVVPARANQPHPRGELQEVVQALSPEQLLETGKQRYEAGQFSEAANFWQQAAQAYAAAGATLNQVQALNYLATAYQELGQWQAAEKAISQSLELLSKLNSPNATLLLAQALNTQGSIQLATGKTETALATWKQAEAAYSRAGNETGKLGSRINQATALQALGQYRQAKNLLEQLVKELQTQPDSILKANGLRSLGVALQTIGDLGRSKTILEASWAISERLNATADVGAILLSIGNVARDLQQYEVALSYYQAAQKKAPQAIASTQALFNQLSLLVETNQREKALALIPQVESTLANLSLNRSSIYARVNVAESLNRLSINNPQKIGNILAIAIQQARQLGDTRAEAYALTGLGKLYEANQQWQDSKNLTEQALQLAQNIDAADITARAAWQLGRILKQQQNITGAIAAYQTAYQTLQSLRSDLVAINPDVQFNFRESVEPVYREFVSLLLQPDASQAAIKQARATIEALQIAELDNFFRDACLDLKPVQIDAIDTKAAVFYPIILSDRLEVILSLPNQPLRHWATQLPAANIEGTLQQLYSSLYPGYNSSERLRLSEQVYNWLIQPAQSDLNNSKIATLVFIPDGFLRNLPMASLYDGKQYLVEKYNVALSSGLQLFPENLARKNFTTLAVGLTQARQGFSALPGVQEEVKQIASEVNSKILLDQAFTSNTFKEAINGKSYQIVHLATHGQFSSNPAETFLLTWDDRIDVKDFDVLFNKRKLGLLEPIELLVLSACQTASGDKRATLGLAGLALRSGAHSTLASLWSVNDQSTADLMSEFYRQLIGANQSMTKAEALRQAQLTLLHNPLYNHPYFWASFVLVGNWL
jgi:CHAT domain-containing protein